MFSIFCGLLVVICLLATIVETLRVSNKPYQGEAIEDGGHISMEKDANERTPLLSDITTKVEKDKGKIND